MIDIRQMMWHGYVALGIIKDERVNTDPKQSARPCGCDPGADHTCQECLVDAIEDDTAELRASLLRAKQEENERNQLYKEASLEDHGREIGQFITKDSGERKQFESGMQRDTTTGKLLFHLVRFGPMFLRWVSLMTRGAIKYDANNWMKAEGKAELTRFTESADRHFAIWMEYRLTGRNIEDPNNPTYLPLTEDHAAAVFFNINGAEYVADRLPKATSAAKSVAAAAINQAWRERDAAMQAAETKRIDSEVEAIKRRIGGR